MFLLLLAITAMAGDAREHVARLTLTPLSPGGDPQSIPVYTVDSIDYAEFGVHLDDQLSGLDVAAYLESRGRLLGARYSVWLYRFDDEDTADLAALSSATLVINASPALRFPLDESPIVSGKTYVWQVVATLEDGNGGNIALWSTPLYFKTAPVESAIPAIIDAEPQRLVERLLLLTTLQRREQAGIASVLRGLPLYSNYPSASDVYICSPLTGDGICPLLTGNGDGITIKQLDALGKLHRLALYARDACIATGSAGDELGVLGDDVYALVTQWPGGTVEPLKSRVSILASIAEKMTAAGAVASQEQALALLSELLVAIDEIAGTGTTQLPGSYENAFLNYAAETASHLDKVAEMETALVSVLGEQSASDWLGYFQRQQTALAVLADEVSRGRLSKMQLNTRIAEVCSSNTPPEPGEVRYLREGSSLVDVERIKRLTAADTEQIAKLSAELVQRHLTLIADSIWPAKR